MNRARSQTTDFYSHFWIHNFVDGMIFIMHTPSCCECRQSCPFKADDFFFLGFMPAPHAGAASGLAKHGE